MITYRHIVDTALCKNYGVNTVNTGSSSDHDLWGCTYNGMYNTFKPITEVAKYFIPNRKDWWGKFYVLNFIVFEDK